MISNTILREIDEVYNSTKKDIDSSIRRHLLYQNEIPNSVWSNKSLYNSKVKSKTNSKISYKEKSFKTLLKNEEIEKHGLVIVNDFESNQWIIDQVRKYNNIWEKDLIERIKNLKEIATEEELPFSEKSLSGALSFSKMIQSSTYPSVFLIGNGNLRFLWEKGEEQIGLQFLDENNSQYVFFSRDEKSVHRHMGTSNNINLIKIIKLFSLYGLMSS